MPRNSPTPEDRSTYLSLRIGKEFNSPKAGVGYGGECSGGVGISRARLDYCVYAVALVIIQN
jgi:hypothetical protein